jgi:hypothetical protein
MGHDAVVFKTQHSHPCSSYSREKELSCRQVVPGSETCAFNRMGTQTINSSTYFSNPLLTPEVEETKTDVELRALPEELSNSLV